MLYLTPRLIAPRLPAFVAHYEDRVFHLLADQGPYSEIFTLGEFEPPQSAAVRALLRPGDHVVDVGANLGWFTMLMAAQVKPDGKVWAIEPMPPTLAALEENVGLNPTLNVTVLPLALGAEEGELDLHLFEGLPHGHASASTLGRSDYESYRVPVRTLDALLDGERAPSFVKVDVEGSELDVLKGAERLLGGERPPMWMLEVNYETSAALGYRPVEMLEPFHRRDGYEVHRVTQSGLVPEDDPEQAPNGVDWVLIPEAFRERLSSASAPESR